MEGGVEVSVIHHIGAQIQLDAGWNQPLTNFIGNGEWSYRYSVGPAFHFGKNILPST